MAGKMPVKLLGLDLRLASCRYPFVAAAFVIMRLARSLVMALAGILVTSVDACAEVVRECGGGLSSFVKEVVG